MGSNKFNTFIIANKSLNIKSTANYGITKKKEYTSYSGITL